MKEVSFIELSGFIQKPVIAAFTFNNRMKYLNRFFAQIPITGFLPHAGKEVVLNRHPLSERKIDVIYAGGFSKNFVGNIMPDFSKYQTFDAKKYAKKSMMI